MKDHLTEKDYYRFLQCPHWPYYERKATEQEKNLKRHVTESEIRRQENDVADEEEIVNSLYPGIIKIKKQENIEVGFQETLEAMKKGVDYIYRPVLLKNDWLGSPDVIKKVTGESALASWHYVPVDIKSLHGIEKYNKLQMMFYAVILEEMQSRFPARGYIANKDGEEYEIELGSQVEEFHDITQALESILAGEKPLPVLRKSCFDTGPCGEACRINA